MSWLPELMLTNQSTRNTLFTVEKLPIICGAIWYSHLFACVFFSECDSSKNTYLYKENTCIQFASYGLIWDVATNKYQVTVSWKIMDAYFFINILFCRRPAFDAAALQNRNHLPTLDSLRWRVDVAISTRWVQVIIWWWIDFILLFEKLNFS